MDEKSYPKVGQYRNKLHLFCSTLEYMYIIYVKKYIWVYKVKGVLHKLFMQILKHTTRSLTCLIYGIYFLKYTKRYLKSI